ncbi:rhodanese-like domain-containing protein [Methylomonas sp. SURF-2]|uniref:Rhodanese-like domain-containing protein n=1 Tax=Methylomonas subterranea TaxID=2952225 RepID=A0ABT1TCE5_9GAMM|nr:rhodanese-like domain-containing protein [Methylomonas sp. SURF-2]MCQ8103135.1 rhodanese-like domain-containing protein [Methylomonas sp. SURF-2]
MKKIVNLIFAGLLFLGHATLADEPTAVSPEQLLKMQQNQNALVVDIRTEAEWQSSGLIADSRKLQAFDPQGRFDPDQWAADLRKMQSSPDQAVILVCRSGNRSGKVGALLTQKLGMKNVYHLDNGLQSWLKAGHPVSPNCIQVACK